MKKGKIRLFSLIFAASLLLTGCGPEPLYEMTEAERALIVQGAAKVLAKHNIKQTDGINSRKPTEAELAEPIEETETEDDSMNQINLDEPGIEGLTTIQAAMGQAKLELTYNGFSVDDSYQEGVYLLVTPAEGKKFVILKYTLRNPFVDQIDVDAMTMGAVYYANFGDGNYIKNESAIMNYGINDYKGTLEAGDSVDLVLLFQVDESFDVSNTLRTMKVEVGGKKYYIDM